MGGIVTRRVGVVGEQDKAGPTIIERRADHHQRLGRHVVPCGLHALGEQPKGIDSVEIGRVDASRHVVPAVEIEGQRRPGLAKRGGVATDAVPDVGTDAVDVNVQLVLGSGGGRIDRHADGLSGEFDLCPPRDVSPRLPCGAPVVRCVGSEKVRTLDAGDRSRSDEQVLCRAEHILQDRIAVTFAVGEIDVFARRGPAIVQLVDDAQVMNHMPQGRALRTVDESDRDKRQRSCKGDQGRTRWITGSVRRVGRKGRIPLLAIGAFSRARESAVTSGAVGIVLGAEVRAQQPLFRTDAREDRRYNERP